MIAAASAEESTVQKNAAALVRQLLRSLSDPPAVVQNELVAALFAGGDRDAQYERVRQAALQAVEALRPPPDVPAAAGLHRQRQYEILIRYDVRRRPLDEVLRALWIEKSQFYRERASAFDDVAKTFCAWLEAQAPAPAFNSEEYRIATALQRSGNSALARTMLERLARSSSGVEKGRCLLRIAELHVDGGDAKRAHEYVAAALAQAEHGDEQLPLLECDATLVQAQIAWATGASAKALAILQPAIAGVRSLLGSGEDGARGLLGRALALEANIAFHTATLDECARLVDEGFAVLRGTGDRTADTIADLLTIRTSIHTTKLGALDDATAYDQALMDFAKEHGLVRKLAVGVKDLAVINHYRGNRAEARLYADQALALSTAVCGSKERAVATFEWAHVHVENGDAGAMERVREAVAQTRQALPSGGFWWAYSYAIESYALLAQRRPEEALNEAQVALACFRIIGSDRGIGITNALLARGLRMIGQTRESRTHAERAVEHLNRAPQTFWLPYAQELLDTAS